MVRRKGKILPSLSSPPPPPSSSSSCKDPESVLKLLPVTILALASSLPTHDREVLAYLIARSLIIPPTTNLHHLHPDIKFKRTSKYISVKNVAFLGCGCFDCYTSFWYRWDSSPNRELIHQIIDEFEEYLVINESLLKKQNNKGKRRGMEVVGQLHLQPDISSCLVPEVEKKGEEQVGGDDVVTSGNLQVLGGLQLSTVRSNHKCLARKVLPDVVGLLNSRLLNLWTPGI